MKLNALAPGSRVALVAPASPFDFDRFERACEMLRNEGYEPAPGKHIGKRDGYLAGSEAERAQDLLEAFSDPAISAVICIRGGYGSGRLIPFLPYSTLRKHPKIFLGHSDITFLHLAFQTRMQWVTFHGPNLNAFADNGETQAHALRALAGLDAFSWELRDSRILKRGTASGMVTGGNLTCLAHLIGTPWFPDLQGAILMIEDCGEALYRIDRIITHLKLSGALRGLAGLVLGQFTDCGEQCKIWEMVLRQVEEFHFPVIADLPFGHGLENEVIPFGVPFRLSTHERTFKAIEHPFL